jgi:putative flippase GtrA
MKLAAYTLDPRLFRFVIVGVLNTAFGYLIYACLLWVGFNYAAAAALGTILAVLFNFKSTGRWVFGSNDNRLLIKFIGVYVIVYIVNVIGLWLLTSSGLSAYTAGLVTLLPGALLSFLLNKTFVFRSSP